MDCLGGVKKEERLLRRLGGMLVEEAQAAVEEDHVDFLHLEIRRDHPGYPSR